MEQRYFFMQNQALGAKQVQRNYGVSWDSKLSVSGIYLLAECRDDAVVIIHGVTSSICASNDLFWRNQASGISKMRLSRRLAPMPPHMVRMCGSHKSYLYRKKAPIP